MTVNVKFLWWKNTKTWKVSGRDMNEIIEKCWELVYKYKAQHFEILD